MKYVHQEEDFPHKAFDPQFLSESIPRESSVRTKLNLEVREDEHLSIQLMC